MAKATSTTPLEAKFAQDSDHHEEVRLSKPSPSGTLATSRTASTTTGDSEFTTTPPSSNVKGAESNNRTYQREEHFHLSLKRAAAIRRRLSRSNQSLENPSSEEIRVARALGAAATAFCNSSPNGRDVSIFDAAIDLATGGGNAPPGQKGQGINSSFSLANTENWSLPELVGVLVNRSRHTIVQQQEEIRCLRTTVKELIRELLKHNDDIQSNGNTKMQASPPDIIEIQDDVEHSALRSVPCDRLDASQKQRGLSTPMTVSPIGGPTSLKNDGEDTKKEGSSPVDYFYRPPYSSPSIQRHLFEKGFITRQDLTPTGDSEDGPRHEALQDVAKSLDSTLKETEQHDHTLAFVGPTEEHTFSEWRAKRVLRGRSPGPTYSDGPKAKLSSEDSPRERLQVVKKSRVPSFDEWRTAKGDETEEGPETTAKTTSNPETEKTSFEGADTADGKDAVENTQGGQIVESILDSLINRSIDLTEDKSNFDQAMFPSLLREQPSEETRESPFTEDFEDAEVDVTPSLTQSMVVLTSFGNTEDSLEHNYVSLLPPANYSGASEDSNPSSLQIVTQEMNPIQKSKGKASDPPGQLVRKESEIVENVNTDYLSSDGAEKRKLKDPTRVSHPGRQPKSVSTKDAYVNKGGLSKNVSETDSPHETLESGVAEADNDASGAYDQVGRRMVVLYSGTPINRTQAAKQERCLVFLQANDIETELVDGSDPDEKELRNKLFQISRLRGIYPQFFVAEDDGSTVYFGDFGMVEQLNETGELRSTFDNLGDNASLETDTRADLNDGVHQEEKKEDRTASLSSRPPDSSTEKVPRTTRREEPSSPTPSSPNRSFHVPDDGDDHPAAPHRSDTPTMTLVPQLRQELAVPGDARPVMFVREVEFSLMDPSPIYDVDDAGRLPVIKEDHRASEKKTRKKYLPVLENIGSDLSSSLEQYTDEPLDDMNRWI